MFDWLNQLWKRFLDWVDYRTGALQFVREQLVEYRLPPKLNKWYSLGGLCLFIFVMQIVTGVLLMLYYVPSTELAFQSIERIMMDIPYGWLVRLSHALGSQMMVFMVMLHLVSVVFMGAYKKPRELTWLSGALLLFLTLGICFTGYLLPWSQLSYWATTVATKIPEPLPWIGPFIVKLIRGGDNITPDTLNRFFTLHVIVIPAAMLALVGFHLLLVRLLGISDPEEPVTPEEKPYVPETEI